MPGPVSNRDSVFKFHVERLSNGDVYFTLDSAEHPSKPERPGWIRMYQDCRCYIKKGETPNVWHLTEIAHLDYLGNVSTKFVNSRYGKSAL